MESIEEINPVLQELVRRASGVDQVILGNQGSPSPLGRYATYSLNPIRAYGHTQLKRKLAPAAEQFDPALGEWTDLEESACTSMEFMLSVNIFNEGAATAAMRLQNANFRAPVRDYLFGHKIAWRYASNARNLSGLMQAGIQPRYQTDIHLFIDTEIRYTVLRAAGFAIDVVDDTGSQSWTGPTAYRYYASEFVADSAEFDITMNDTFPTNGA